MPHPSITTAILFSFLIQVVYSASLPSSSVVINRGDNANGDNDETTAVPLPPHPPIHQQFAAVSSRLSPNLKGAQEPGREVPAEGEDGPKKTPETDDNEEEDGGVAGFAESGAEEPEGRSLSSAHYASGKKGGLRQSPSAFQQAVGCGYFRMKAGQAYSIQSTNFNSGGTFRNFEQCTWKFFGQQCKVKASCPCFSLPSTPDCNGDLLKVTDLYSFSHKFCGDSTPLGTYNSTTNNLKVHFRSDGQANDGGEGFRCYVTCTGYGKQDPVQLSYNSTVCSSSRPLGS